MKRHGNLFCRRWFAAGALVLALAGGRLQAESTSEKLAWKRACDEFSEAKAPIMWGLVESRFADFITNFPASEHYAEAVVFEARALYEQEKYDTVVSLLTAQAPKAGQASDKFAYWTAKAYFQEKKYGAAADTFARLVRENPNSELKLEAIFREAEAHAKLEYWPRVIEELREPDGAFQRMARTNRSDELVVSGLLLLGQAELAQKDFATAEKTLSGIAIGNLHPELEWDRQFLLCRTQLESGQAAVALSTSTNLLAAADKPELRARSIVLQGEIHEQLEEFPEAIAAYATNLSSDLPAEWRRQALLKIVELTLRQNMTEAAAKFLEDFLASHPEEQGTDFELLVLGELRLKEQYRPLEGTPPAAGATNFAELAAADFEKLIRNFTNSQYLGKAELNLGWCRLTEGRIPESQAAFSNAVEHLPFSEDQAVARFKLADILYQQQDFPGAMENYNQIISRYGSLPAVKNDLFEQALYQIVRAGLAQTNLAAATDAVNRILEWFPDGLLADRSMLLVGQTESPAQAREIFSEFVARFPQSPLLPEVKLAMARTYDKETNWVEAVARYDAWVETYTNSSALPRAEFLLAWANDKAGNKTNAFALFTNLVARFQTNETALSNDLPARAQYWVGDFFWNTNEFQKAEVSYKEVFNNWPQSQLAFPARMMAGRAALQRQDPQQAINYFTSLTSNSNCPPELFAKALFATGDATLQLPAATDSAKLAKYNDAIAAFHYIATQYTNTEIGTLAWARLGDCYLAIAANDRSQYDTASNAFALVMGSSLANATTRGMAEFRLGQTLEALARLEPADGQKPLLQLALGHFLNVLNGNYLRENEPADLDWAKDAGLEAATLAEGLHEWRQAVQFYEQLKKIFPPLQTMLEKKIAKAQENLVSEKN